MKILVFDDSQVHRDAAISQLAGHELVVVETYDQAEQFLSKEIRGMPNSDFQEFDVVMTDLMVPPSNRSLSPSARMDFEGKELPLGIFIAIRALSVGVKKVAVITDASHHDHPGSAIFDTLYGFAHEGLKLCLTNFDVAVENGVVVKQWGSVLEYLLED